MSGAGPEPGAGGDERLAALVARCGAIADPGLRDDMVELLQRVLELHRQGLARMLEAPAAAWGSAPEVEALLELHGLAAPPPFRILPSD